MDVRKWFLLETKPDISSPFPMVKYVPDSESRSPSALRLFLAGYECEFELTDSQGRPTPALHLMAKMMGAQLVPADQLPTEERVAFSRPGPCLIDVESGVDRHWYLRGITKRLVAANASGNMNPWANGSDWHQKFLPGWEGDRLTYKDPDGKKRKRVCIVAKCPPNWEMTQDVYRGIWRWTREHEGPPERYRGFSPVPWPDAYTLIREVPALNAGRSAVSLRGAEQGPRATAPQGIPATTCRDDLCGAEGNLAEAVGC